MYSHKRIRYFIYIYCFFLLLTLLSLYSNSCFDFHQTQGSRVFENIALGTFFVYITLGLGRPACLSKGGCLYAGADWLKHVCQSAAGERSATYFFPPTLIWSSRIVGVMKSLFDYFFCCWLFDT